MFFTIARNIKPTVFKRAASHALAVMAGIVVGSMVTGTDTAALIQHLTAPKADALLAQDSGSETMPSGNIRAAGAIVLELQPVVKPVDVLLRDTERELRRAL